MCGHHLALNCLVIGGQMVLTPAFMGAEPNYADTGPWAGTRLFEDEENGGLALVRALTNAQHERHIERASIEHSLANLRTFPWIRMKENRKELSIHGAWFDISMGELHAYDETAAEWEIVS